MCPFRNSLFRDQIKHHAVRFTMETQALKKCEPTDGYSEALDKNYKALLKFYRENMLASDDISDGSPLQHWRRWMEKRRNMHLYLGWKQNRNSAWLVMNSAEDRRTEMEVKALLEHAQELEDEPDRYRGDPAFWTASSSILNLRCTCGPPPKARDYRSFPPPPKQRQPVKEYVGVPTYIRQVEKAIAGGEGDEWMARGVWARTRYLRERTAALAPRIRRIKAFFPDTTELIVQGRAMPGLQGQIQPSKPSDEDLPRLLFETPSDVSVDLIANQPEEGMSTRGSGDSPLAQLRVGDVLLRREVVGADRRGPARALYYASGPLRCDLDFAAPVDIRVAASLRFENEGQMALTLRWVPLSAGNGGEGGGQRPLQCFFMDKGHFNCPPGQVREKLVWFHSPVAGVFYESWELRVEPRLTAPNRRFVLRLWGVTSDFEDDHEDDHEGDHDTGGKREGVHVIESWSSTGAARSSSSAAAAAAAIPPPPPPPQPARRLPARRQPARASDVLRHVDRCVASAQALETLAELTGPRLQRPPPQPPSRTLYLDDEVFQHRNPGYFYRSEALQRLKELFSEVSEQPEEEWDLSLATLRRLLLNPPRPLELQKQQDMLADMHEALRTMKSPLDMPEGVTARGARAAAYSALCLFATAMEREATALREVYGLPPVKAPSPQTSQASRKRVASSSAAVRESRVVSETEVDAAEAPVEEAEAAVISEERCSRDLYLAALFVRVYHLLGDAVDRMVAAVGAPDLLRCPPAHSPPPLEAKCGTANWPEDLV